MPFAISKAIDLYNRGRYRDLIQVIEREYKSQPDIAFDFLYYYVLASINIQEFKKALIMIEVLIARSLSKRGELQCRMLKGYAYSGCHEYKLAELEFLYLLDERFFLIEVYGALAHVNLKLDKVSVAIEYLEKALELDENNINALNSMSYALANYDLDYSKASEYISRVIAVEPKNPVYLDTYGYVLFKLGKYREAERILSYAYEIDANISIKEHLDEVKRELLV